MSIILEKLVARGIGREEAVVEFRANGSLIRGPSDTGKSHIKDCLWYLLGGEKAPKGIPQNEGYDTLLLQTRTSDGGEYTIMRGMTGGSAVVYPSTISEIANAAPVPDEVGQLLVSLAGAAGLIILRSMAKRGPLTGGDLRHWSLISQPAMISESPTIGTPTEQPQRRASFSVFLTGRDDSAVVLAATKDEKIRIRSKIESLEDGLRRINADLPEGSSISEVKSALERIDTTFSVLSSQQIRRSQTLRGLRERLIGLSTEISSLNRQHAYSAVMVDRFEMLSGKYDSDYARLVAISDGISIFDTIQDQPCPLCRTPTGDQKSEVVLDSSASRLQRVAMQAEANKIAGLKAGLMEAIEREVRAEKQCAARLAELQAEFEQVEAEEQKAITANVEEFSVDPKSLAIQRSELYSLQKNFEEFDRLNAELQRLKALTPKKGAPLQRQTRADAIAVAKYALEFLHAWGLTAIRSVELDAVECDLNVDGRARLSYGAGMRSIFLAAMIVALLAHAMASKHPHIGFVVLDSPMKSYSDPKNKADISVSPATVKDAFYSWLASWSGPGQVIVLENEPISAETAIRLKPTEFTRSLTEGRYGFYPLRPNDSASQASEA
jgi:hypothetical protein